VSLLLLENLAKILVKTEKGGGGSGLGDELVNHRGSSQIVDE
jgi:hypothetical protein